MNFAVEWIIMPILFCFILAIPVAAIFAIYNAFTSTPPETFSLRVKDFECTAPREFEKEYCSAKIGCHWETIKVCDQWSLKK